MMRILAWLLVAAITALTVVPPALRPVSALPHAVEHLVIFFALGAALALAYPRRDPALAIAGVSFAATLEALQIVTPGRHARLSDFVIDAAGIALAAVVARLRRTGRYPSLGQGG